MRIPRVTAAERDLILDGQGNVAAYRQRAAVPGTAAERIAARLEPHTLSESQMLGMRRAIARAADYLQHREAVVQGSVHLPGEL